MLKALIFDCDGVLAETEKDGHRVAFNKAFEKENIDVYWDEELYGHLVKISGGKERMKHYFQNTNSFNEKYIDNEYIRELHKIKTEIFQNIIKQGALPIRTGIKRIIKEAYDKEIELFICSTSNEKSVKTIADSIFEDFLWYTKIFAGDVVIKKKPSPDIYNLVKEHYGFKGDECVVIEDSHNGLLAAKSAGMNCLITTSHYSKYEDFSKADLVVNSLGDFNTKCKIINDPNNIFINNDIHYITLKDLNKII